jgi:hydrogenase maturation factor
MGAFEDQFGKISATIFKEAILDACGAAREEVICGPGFGVDTAVVDLGSGQALAISSDPLSLIPALGMKVSAWLSVHLLVNDMSTTGYAPQYAQFVLNLPPDLSREHFVEYWGHIHTLCKELNIAITGGHTGQIPAQESTIAGGGTMFLQAPKDKIITSKQAQAGDSIIVSKQVALSSTSLLAMAFPETVAQRCGAETQQRAADNFWKLSVLREGVLAARSLEPNEELHAMHDVTEGGVLGALHEMAIASDCGFRVATDRLPISPEIQMVADLFEIDPFFSVGAGAMIMAVKKGCEDKLIGSLTAAGIPAVKVGEFTDRDTLELVDAAGVRRPFDFDGVDPYWAAFYKALQSGWK